MKRVFLLMSVSALLVTLGFAQTPVAGSNTDLANVKGCLGGSDGNYTVAEHGTRQIFKITTTSVDLKPHLGHDVTLMGHKTSGTVSSGTGDDSFAVTELNMISEHCASAAAASVDTVIPPSETVIAPAAAAAPSATASTDASAPAATVGPSSATVSTPAVEAAAPAATVSTPAADASAPAATVGPSSATVSTPAVEAAAPAAMVSTPATDTPAAAATVSPSSATVSTPAAKAAQPPRRSAHPRRPSTTQAAAATAPAATVSPSSETVSPAAADAATAGPSLETVSTPAAAATTPPVTHRAGSLWLLISFVVLVIVLGTLVPLLSRWRKRKILERTGTPNLSFINEASSGRDKPKPRKVA
jgi:hypothetical protein